MRGHGAVEFVAGLAMIAAPAILPFGTAGLVVSVSLGALLLGMALIVASSPHDQALAWHASFDIAFVLLTAIAALGLALGGAATAAVFFAAVAFLQAFLNTTTKYVIT